MKLRILLGTVASLALVGRTASAQACQGDLSFAGSKAHVAGGLGLSDNATAFNAGMNFGRPQGLYGGGALGLVNYDNISGNTMAIGGSVGYAMPMAQGSKWQMCPTGSLSLGFGPSIDAGAAGTMKMSQQTINAGVSIGSAMPLSQSLTLVPFGAAGLGWTRAAASIGGTSTSDSKAYLALAVGAGFQFSPSFSVRPALNLAVGADNMVDDTVFSLGFSFALPK